MIAGKRAAATAKPNTLRRSIRRYQQLSDERVREVAVPLVLEIEIITK